MISVLAHNITSPLGMTTDENFEAVAAGRDSIRQWHNHRGVPNDFTASLFSDEQLADLQISVYTLFESLAITSARKAIAESGWRVDNGSTVLVISTTKGNIGELDGEKLDDSAILPGRSAAKIAKALGIKTTPIVVDNACISGLSAIILASRLLDMGFYSHAVVIGAEVQSKFIISGFQSLKATSGKPCRPFDIERTGLNLGEAAATILLAKNENSERGYWHVVSDCQRNDAFHLSAPSRNGEGAWLALSQCTGGFSPGDIAFINAHGTATMFNDQMESVAIERAGLASVPVNALKGYYGHTMGACGVLETILSMQAIDNGIILPTRGYSEPGVSGKIDIVDSIRQSSKQSFVKMLSGFGGGNASLLMSKTEESRNSSCQVPSINTVHQLHITNDSVTVNGKKISTVGTGKAMLTALYKQHVGNYPKFYKMDILCRLGFIATELLLNAEGKERFQDCDSRAVALVGRYGSWVADCNYYQSIANPDDYFPSPERFVYTLPNIVTGEIAIRNHYHGETGFFYLDEEDKDTIMNIIASDFADPTTKSIIGGWIDCRSNDDFNADIYIFEQNYYNRLWKN